MDESIHGFSSQAIKGPPDQMNLIRTKLKENWFENRLS